MCHKHKEDDFRYLVSKYAVATQELLRPPWRSEEILGSAVATL
jgi:hypothetical protein